MASRVFAPATPVVSGLKKQMQRSSGANKQQTNNAALADLISVISYVLLK
jgi:hypothetical protein